MGPRDPGAPAGAQAAVTASDTGDGVLVAVSALLPVVLGAKRDLARQISLLGTITAFVTAAAWLGLPILGVWPRVLLF